MPDCGQLPINDRDDLRSGWVKYAIVHFEVTVHNADSISRLLLIDRTHEVIEMRNIWNALVHCSLRPAHSRQISGLPRKVLFVATKPFESYRAKVNVVQASKYVDESQPDGTPLFLWRIL